MRDYNERVKEFVYHGIAESRIIEREDPFWRSLAATGTELWLDTGDIGEAESNWSAGMSALTTNNTLLNNEIQKGIYDEFIKEALEIVSDLPEDKRVKEIAFILNARHGLRLAARFGGLVSVELHTDTAHDIEAIVGYGMRFHSIAPENFIVKVPLTASGLIGARKLKDAGVKINFTLEFSARQNALVTLVTRPDYLNVFLGRVGAYIADNNLGDGTGAGERAVLSSQKQVTELSRENPHQTRLIAASLRSYKQLESLAGTDVYTMPPKVAAEGRARLSGNFKSMLDEVYPVGINEEAISSGVEKFWEVAGVVHDFGRAMSAKLPKSGEELEELAGKAGLKDMFPVLSHEEEALIVSDGKIPVYDHWKEKLQAGDIAPDTLLTLAGLASFSMDQKELDNRIARIIF
jgi:transaldolase